MANHLFLKESDKNIVFSPLSFQVVLSLIAAGSEGPTEQQLLTFYLVSVLLKDVAPIGGPCLSLVDGVWVELSKPYLFNLPSNK